MWLLKTPNALPRLSLRAFFSTFYPWHPSSSRCFTRSGESSVHLTYYLHARTDLALDKDPPISRSVAPPSAGRVVATPQVGGLHHRYDRVAA